MLFASCRRRVGLRGATNPQKGGPKYGFGGAVIELPVLLKLMPKLRCIKRGSKGYQKFWVGNLLNLLIRRKNPKVYQKFWCEKGCISSIYYKYITHLYPFDTFDRGVAHAICWFYPLLPGRSQLPPFWVTRVYAGYQKVQKYLGSFCAKLEASRRVEIGRVLSNSKTDGEG